MYQMFCPENVKDILTIRELASELDVSYDTVLRWARQGSQGVQLRVCRTTCGLGSSHAEYDRFVRAINNGSQSSQS